MQKKHLCLNFLFLLTMAFFTNCDDNSVTPPEFENTGFQKGEDWYDAADYTWVDIQSSAQLQGNWSGTKILQKDSVWQVHPAYELAVTLQFKGVNSLYVIEEKHWFVDAVNQLNQGKKEEYRDTTWLDLRKKLSLSSTGSSIFPTYPDAFTLPSEDSFNWQRFLDIEMCLFSKDQRTLNPEWLPDWVMEYSMKINDDGTKLLIQYSDHIQFVVGKRAP